MKSCGCKDLLQSNTFGLVTCNYKIFIYMFIKNLLLILHMIILLKIFMRGEIMNTAEYIVKRLEELGVNDFFGLPGDYNFNLLYAVENNPNTKWVGCTNELNAGYAADGYARIRGYGALITTYGVGELSAINAIAGAMAENIPIIHIVGLPSSDKIENKDLIHHNFQEVNYQNFINAYKQVTAATVFLAKDNAKLEIDRVLKVLVRDKKPVYIAIPSDVAQMEISDRVVSYDWVSDRKILEEVADKICNKISKSKQPAIIGDVLIKRFDSKIEYKEFVEKSGIPVSNFLMGSNLIDINYAKYLGGFYGSLRNPIAQKYIDETDCLISVGAIYSDINTYGFSIPFDINKHIAIYGNYTYIDGKKYENVKMSEVLEAITEKIEYKDIEIDKPNIGYKHKEADNEPITADFIYPQIQEFLKENDILITETGTTLFGVAQMGFPASTNIEIQSLWGSIGWATPATLGASLAKPQARVILLTGEGAHQLTAMEVGNMLRRGIKPIIIVINNNGYTTERMLSDSSQDKFNDILQMNYSKFARVFEGDVWATKVNTSEDFDKALKVTQIMNKLCYIEVCTDKLDAPQLIWGYINSIKSTTPYTTVSNAGSKKEYDDMDNIILSSSISSSENGFEYETVVHQGFVEEKAAEKISSEEEK